MSYFATNYTYILTHTMLPVPNSFENYMYIVFYEKNILFKNGVLLITLFYFVFIIFLFILCVWVFFCMCVYAPCACLLHTDSRRGHQISLNWSYSCELPCASWELNPVLITHAEISSTVVHICNTSDGEM